MTGLLYKSWVLHGSIAVAAIQPANPRAETQKPITWQIVVDIFPSAKLKVMPKVLFTALANCGCGSPYQMVSINKFCLLNLFLQDKAVSLLMNVLSVSGWWH